MQIFDVLKQDHREALDLLGQLAGTTDRAEKKREQLFHKVRAELLAHAHAEQQVFYLPLKEYEETEEAELKAECEHQIVERLLQDMEQMSKSDPRFLAGAKVLKELVQHHVKEEEGEMFKLARKVLDRDQLRQMATDMQNRKQQELRRVA